MPALANDAPSKRLMYDAVDRAAASDSSAFSLPLTLAGPDLTIGLLGRYP